MSTNETIQVCHTLNQYSELDSDTNTDDDFSDDAD